MSRSIFSVNAVSPLAGTLLRLSAIGSLVVAGTKLYLAPQVTQGLADLQLSEATKPAKANKIAWTDTIAYLLVGGLLQLKWSYTGIASVIDKATFAVLSLSYLTGGAGLYRIGFTKPAFAYAVAVVPMLSALVVE